MQTYYKIMDDVNGQHGTNILTIQMEKEEFERLIKIYGKGYVLFKDYENAIDYILD